MRIACSRCETRYDLPEEKLSRGPVKIRCSRCAHVFVVKRKVEPSEESPSRNSAQFEDFDFASFEPPQGPVSPAPEVPAPGTLPLEDFDFAAFDTRQRPPVPGPEAPVPESASFGDFDFGSFETPPTPGAGPRAAAAEPPSSLFADEDLPPIGELDLGEFEDEREGFGSGSDTGAPEPTRSQDPETEKVRTEDLVSPALGGRKGLAQGLAEDVPRLDLQKGPRRTDVAARPSRLVARDRSRSPLLWAVTAIALGTAIFTGYNVYRHPDKAFSLLNLNWVREIWRNRESDARFVTEDVRGYAQTLPGGRRAFLIRGHVVNRSSTPQGLVRVRGNLFAGDGSRLASSEVYCGNVLSNRELATLPRSTIEARLQNQVGEALSNVDIAPGGKVPFLVVFLSPSARVEKFSVQVTASRAGSGA